MNQNELFETGIRKQNRRANLFSVAVDPGWAICAWEECGIRFKISSTRRAAGPNAQRFHSRKCSSAWRHAHEQEWQERAICRECGREFIPKRKERRIMCPDCAGPNTRKRLISALILGLQNPLWQLVKVLSRFVECKICGNKSFHVLCSRECDLEYRRRLSHDREKRKHDGCRKQFKCRECGNLNDPEYGQKQRNFCNDFCSIKYARRIARGVRRARERAVEYENVDPRVIWQRDSGRCQLCKRKTPWSLRGTWNDRAPEVDHIRPLSKGGSHAYRNCQNACRRCNQDKSDQEYGQLRML